MEQSHKLNVLRFEYLFRIQEQVAHLVEEQGLELDLGPIGISGEAEVWLQVVDMVISYKISPESVKHHMSVITRSLLEGSRELQEQRRKDLEDKDKQEFIDLMKYLNTSVVFNIDINKMLSLPGGGVASASQVLITLVSDGENIPGHWVYADRIPTGGVSNWLDCNHYTRERILTGVVSREQIIDLFYALGLEILEVG